jgi:hypothetical protein
VEQVAAVSEVRVYVPFERPSSVTSAAPPSMCAASVATSPRAVWHASQPMAAAARVVVACFACAPTDTFVRAVPPAVSTGGEARRPGVPWQKVQSVRQPADAAAWQVSQEIPLVPPVRSAPWQLLQPSMPLWFAEYPCCSFAAQPAAWPPAAATMPAMCRARVTRGTGCRR